MQRVTITLDDELMAEVDAIIAARGYQNRSEAIRDLARAGIREAAPSTERKRDCVAALVYVYDHAARQLAKRLTSAYHDHHEMSLASLHVHLDHDTCLEVTVLQRQERRRPAFRRARDRRARRPPWQARAHADGAGGSGRHRRASSPSPSSRSRPSPRPRRPPPSPRTEPRDAGRSPCDARRNGKNATRAQRASLGRALTRP